MSKTVIEEVKATGQMGNISGGMKTVRKQSDEMLETKSQRLKMPFICPSVDVTQLKKSVTLKINQQK